MDTLDMANVMQMVIESPEFAVANDFVIGNTFFVKRDSHLITYQSGNAKTQIEEAKSENG